MRALSILSGCLVLAACQKASGPPEPPVDRYDWRALDDAWVYPQPIPAFRLTDQDGNAFTLADFDDSYLMFGFVFSRCPVPRACPLTMKRLRQVQVAWAQAEKAGRTNGKRLQIIGVTLDPEFDTPEQLKMYGAGYGADWTSWKMATGPEQLVGKELPLMFGVLATPSPNPDAIIRHSVKIAILRPGRNDWKEWRDNDLDPQKVVSEILADSPSRK